MTEPGAAPSTVFRVIERTLGLGLDLEELRT